MRTTERPPGGVQSGGVSLQCGFVHRRSDAVVDVDVSVIAPAFNELENMEPLVERIREVFEPTGMKYEAVIVDDCSTDGTGEKLVELGRKYPWLRVIRLDKNSGQTAAMDAGFRHARGKVWGTVDADMQNDPGEIPRLMKLLGPDVDMVNGWRKDRADKNKFMRRMQSKIANGIRNRLSGRRPLSSW